MARLLQVVVVFGLLAMASSQWVWKGGNTNWDTPSNWVNQLNPKTSSGICATVFANDQVNIQSKLSASVYNVGGSLQLPKDGKLILSKQGTVIKFTSGVATPCTATTTAQFVAGTFLDQNNDFYCHRNWLNGKNAATSPPCKAEVNFPTNNTYKVWLPKNVTGAPIYSIIANGLTIQASDDVLTKLGPQFSGLVPPAASGNLLMSTTSRDAYCADYSDANGNCVCFTTCPDASQASNQASYEVANLNKTITKSFDGTITAAGLGLANGVLGPLLADSNAVNMIEMYLQDSLGSTWNTNDVSTVVSSAGTDKVELAGSVTAVGAYFVVPGTNIVDKNDTTFAITGWNSVDSSSTVGILRLALANAILKTQLAQKTNIANTISNANTQGTTDAFNALNALLSAYSNPLDAFNAAFPSVQSTNLANCASAGSTACQNTISNRLAAATSPALVLASGANATTVAAAVSKLATASSALNTNPAVNGTSLLTSFTSALQAAQNANAQQTQIAANGPQTYTKTAPSFVIGRLRDASEIDALIASTNLDNLRNFFYGLTKNQPRFYLTEMVKSSMTFQKWSFASNSVVSTSPPATRRRRDANFAVLMNFNYTVVCQTNNAGCGIPSNDTNPAVYASVQQQFDVLMTYVQPGANTAPTTTTQAPTTTTTTTVAGKGTTDASTSGGSAGLGLVAGAAAAGVVILVLVIVALIIYNRRKRRPNAVARADDRTVVAFENPMYDDPAHGSAPVYDSTNQNDHEGLYDEPAFQQQQKKDNPLYQSTEGLDQAVYDSAGDQQADGYLDVAAQDGPGGVQDTGYLDQAPPVEDTGYLDQAPQ